MGQSRHLLAYESCVAMTATTITRNRWGAAYGPQPRHSPASGRARLSPNLGPSAHVLLHSLLSQLAGTCAAAKLHQTLCIWNSKGYTHAAAHKAAGPRWVPIPPDRLPTRSFASTPTNSPNRHPRFARSRRLRGRTLALRLASIDLPVLEGLASLMARGVPEAVTFNTMYDNDTAYLLINEMKAFARKVRPTDLADAWMIVWAGVRRGRCAPPHARVLSTLTRPHPLGPNADRQPERKRGRRRGGWQRSRHDDVN